ncbi:MAG: pantoate--beta-alanine ligase [Actinomycetota bacterium]|nr:pantoate--beta-alanine ligase [Actinomycetota bacterium]
MTTLIHHIAEVRDALDQERANGRTIGFVPTMGALHSGHLSLIERTRAECDVVVVSVFVNPLQFGPSEDFSKYPRTLEEDTKLCEEVKADIVFAPSVDEMYPAEPLVTLSAGRLGTILCGHTRPGHFDGVATVVAKLFNATGRCRAYFGRKDAQQLVVIKALVRDLGMPVEVIGCDTVREPDGVAMSSRNRYLNGEERTAASVLYRALNDGLDAIKAGNADPVQVASAMAGTISSEPLARLDYAACVDAEDLQQVTAVEKTVLLAVAAWIGSARLIDNVTATPQGAAIQEV